ncbi:MAG: DUF72 domain-containing protein [Candidatus Hydrogenedentes bacterium]|nr:DUF72 domain-containing protein [Candidatus Hydrogenedentota bacterium]
MGVSGWRYPGWRGRFYPDGLPQKQELRYVSDETNSVEINGSFYSLQRPESYAAWREATSPHFVFSVKGGRFITHMKQLLNVETALANFFASGVLALEEKLGPILWQLPPRMRFDAARLHRFLALLPKSTSAAADAAKGHDDRLKAAAWLRPSRNRRLRHALEARHESFFCEESLALLRRYNVALVASDGGSAWPYAEDVTANFVYLRLHGAEELYSSGYTAQALDEMAAKIGHWRCGTEPPNALRRGPAARKRTRRDVYVYFDNDAKVFAPANAMDLAKRLSQ